MAARSKKMTRHKLLDAPSLIPADVRVQDGTVNIARMIARRSPKDILDMGLLIDTLLKTPTGELVTRTIHNLLDLALYESTQPGMNAERILGRQQGLKAVLNAFEGYMKERLDTQAELRAESRPLEEEPDEA